MSITIPVPAFAIAANTAASYTGEDCADVFDGSKSSRARLMAIIAMRKVYPTAAVAEICASFGWPVHCNKCVSATAAAMLSKWWSDEHVARVEAAIRKAVKIPATVRKGEPLVTPVPAVALTEKSLAGTGLTRKPLVRRNVSADFFEVPKDAAARRALLDSLPNCNASRNHKRGPNYFL